MSESGLLSVAPEGDGSAQDLQRPYGCLVAFAPPEHRGRTGKLTGLSYVAKDMFDTPGRAPTCGLARSPGPVSATTAAVLPILDGQGAARIGFAEMTALAYEPSGANPSRGRPVNPQEPDRICGGSSSGSAVAVAAGLAAFAVGSDTAGSLRIPAHCCGISAWKPSTGLVSGAGAMPLAPSLDTIGFLSRKAGILDRIASCFVPRAGARIRTVLVAVDLTAESEPPVRAAVAAARAALPVASEDVALALLLQRCDEPCLTILQAEAAQSHAATLTHPDLDPALARRLGKGANLPRDTVERAYTALHELRAMDPDDILGDADAILLPVMRFPTPAVASCEPSSPDFSARTLYELSALTRFVNLLGWPAVALPAGLDEGRCGVGVQLVGPPGSDRALLALAAELEERLAVPIRRPEERQPS